MDLTVAIASYGGQEWQELAEQRAYPSAAEQAPVVRVHLPNGTLAEARNQALARAHSELIVFLDADDELEPGYCEAMWRAKADVRVPSLKRVPPGRKPRRGFVPRVWRHSHACTADCLDQGSWVPIGAAARTELLKGIGGFREWPVYEDWCLWLRCQRAGATFEPVPEAVYGAHVRADSRNNIMPISERNDWHYKILAAA